VTAMEQVRLFIAIELPEKVQAELKQLQQSLKSVDPSSVKWVDPNGIHLTLKFLGSVDIDKLEAVKLGLQNAVQGISPFQLELSELGAFPNLKRVQIVWIGLQGDLEALQELQKKIESNISPLGFPTEKRPFKPHLTLARLRETASPQIRQTLGDRLSQTKIENKFTFKANSVNLMRSQLTRGGAIYTCLCSVQLTPSCQ
jgi:RNA 2',3'-cyclic 3'-phosphodiesterase